MPSLKIIGDAAFVPLTRRKPHLPRRYALVDLEDYERITRSKWYAAQGGKNQYAHATSIKFLAKHHELMHAYILRAKPGERVDHISGDTLDNRKQNLRIIQPTGNAQNARRQTFPGKTSRFKGVCWDKREERWLASIRANGERFDLGHFDDEESAALAYDAAAAEKHGEFARTNADMRLYEQEDPFVPDCSWADVFDRHANHFDYSPHKHYRLTTHINYSYRLSSLLRKEIDEAKAS